MKNLIKLLFGTFFIVGAFSSCKKDENKLLYTGGTPPVLTASSTTLPLSFINKDNQAITLNWTNPNYQFNTGISSQDVSYIIEIDKAGANFGPNKQSVAISLDLSASFTQGQFNDYLLNQLVLAPGVTQNIEIRVKSALINNSAVLISNVLTFSVTPYAIPPKVQLPPGHLYLVGSATAGGWNNPVPLPTQEFTKISPTVYEITIPLAGGQEYLFLPVNGDWSHKYAVRTTAPNNVYDNTGGDFGYDYSNNFPGPTASGNYKIQADFQRGKFTVTKL
jgi:starch-binding outer membrane protein SusE/F